MTKNGKFTVHEMIILESKCREKDISGQAKNTYRISIKTLQFSISMIFPYLSTWVLAMITI